MTERLKHIEYVLLIDDDVDLRAAVTLFLQMEHYKVVECANGLEALKILIDPHRVNHPGIILLDLEMPVMTGWDLLNVMKKCEKLAEIPVVVTTGHTIPGVDFEVVKKPYLIEDLMCRVKKRFPLPPAPK